MSEVDVGADVDRDRGKGLAVGEVPGIDGLGAGGEDDVVGDGGSRERVGLGIPAGDASDLRVQSTAPVEARRARTLLPVVTTTVSPKAAGVETQSLM